MSRTLTHDLDDRFPQVGALSAALESVGYLVGEQLGAALFLAVRMGQPILLEGEPGVGKTEAAKALAAAIDTPLVRLQCYEGITASEALYEWNYPRQLLAIRLAEAAGEHIRDKDLFTEEYLLPRPLLTALLHPGPRPAVLLIDEVDRADEEFEAFLLEVLSDFQVSIPEVGTVRAERRPAVVLTSNRSRDLSDALRRRCLYLWIDYPTLEKELRIVRSRVPGLSEQLARELTTFMQSLRRLKLQKTPGVAESLDWAAALVSLHASHLDAALVQETLGCFLKDEADLRALTGRLAQGELEALCSPLG